MSQSSVMFACMGKCAETKTWPCPTEEYQLVSAFYLGGPGALWVFPFPVVCHIGLCACKWSAEAKIPEGVSLTHIHLKK